jgi:hypothetical protein
LSGVEFVVSDDHTGLRQAIVEVLPEAAWQRCYVHFLRNALDYVPRKVDDDCPRELRWLYDPARLRALAVEMHENWLEAHRYLNMDDLREHKKEARGWLPSPCGQRCALPTRAHHRHHDPFCRRSWTQRERTRNCPKGPTDGRCDRWLIFASLLRLKDAGIAAFRQLFDPKSAVESPRRRKSLPAQRLYAKCTDATGVAHLTATPRTPGLPLSPRHPAPLAPLIRGDGFPRSHGPAKDIVNHPNG